MNSLKIKKYAGVILSAGFSSRMDRWKPAIILNASPLIYYTIAPMLRVCHSISVVGGYNFNELKKLLAEKRYFEKQFPDIKPADRISCVENKLFECGMFSSVKKGMEALDNDFDAIFITPGDMPMVSKETYIQMINIFEKENPDVLIPQTLIKSDETESGCRLKKGHPVLISSAVRDEIKRESNQTAALRDVLKRFSIQLFETVDKGIITDVDTEEDLERVIALLKI